VNKLVVDVADRKEFSSAAVRRPINVDSLSKWVGHTSYEPINVDLLSKWAENISYEPINADSMSKWAEHTSYEPINADSLTKWAEHISYDVRADVRSLAPMLDMLGYDADSYPPDYSSTRLALVYHTERPPQYPPDYARMTFTAESLLRQAASRDRST